MLRYWGIAARKQFGERSFERLAHRGVACGAARNRIAGVGNGGATRESDSTIVQFVLPKNPIWNDVLVIEGRCAALDATDEATICFYDVTQESVTAVKQHLPSVIENRLVLSHY